MSTETISAAAATVQSRFLTRVIRLDAVASGALGVLLLGAGWALDGPLGLSSTLSAGAGAFLVLWSAALLMIGRRPAVRRTAVREIVAINLAWVVASLGALFVLELTALGVGFVIVQAVAVGLFAELQLTGLRR
ncbi:hypothetical protein [Kribbella italica]|uniref:Integral membrane protein n=1 Tax=Kribbella italica TaxID=1540520 RepID=A0A7W9J7F1_9ACTN|nr:hypothetical protein [Kribbella italica]MBB5837019.1 hypothetical protein [Kribbella italica]